MADSSFATRLKELRTQAGLSVEQLADKAGLVRQTIYQYEAGQRRPTWEAVQSLADALGVSTETFRARATESLPGQETDHGGK